MNNDTPDHGPNSDAAKSDKSRRHQKAMQKQKARVDAAIAAADRDQGLVVLLTGEGKGKSSSAFGMVMRALGHGQKVGVVQFIKGQQLSGEEIYLRDNYLRRNRPEVTLVQMGTGFTWDTQDREGDMAAARSTWEAAEKLLSDPSVDLVVLDELTYMLAFDYLPETKILDAISQRPSGQNVVITGRGGGTRLRELADTVAEIKDVKHAFSQGIKARPGLDY